METTTVEKYPRSPFDSESAYKVTYPEGDQSIERFDQLPIVNNNMKVHMVKDGETIQGISFHYYKDPGAWDRIALANDILNPYDELEFYPGLNLIIPDLNNIIYF